MSKRLFFKFIRESEWTKFPKGSFSNITSDISCINCPEGTIPDDYGIEYINYKVGFYSNISRSPVCIEYHICTYSHSIGSTKCKEYPLGKVPNNLKTSCVNCSASYFQIL